MIPVRWYPLPVDGPIPMHTTWRIGYAVGANRDGTVRVLTPDGARHTTRDLPANRVQVRDGRTWLPIDTRRLG